MLRRLWPVLSIAVFSGSLFGSDGATDHPRFSGLEEREFQVLSSRAHASEFNTVPHAGSLARCEDVQPPEALTTPNPLVMPVRDRSQVKVSFIIGTDGRVHSPLILESAGPVGDRSVLSAVRIWRFRPATCNGVPTEIEDKIEFSSR